MAVVRSCSMSDEEWEYVKTKGLSISGLLRLGVRANKEEWLSMSEKTPKLVAELERVSQEMFHYQTLYNQMRETMLNVKKVMKN